MSKNITNKQDVVIIGGGTSGVMCALGAIHCGLKVTLICNNTDFSTSSLLTETIPSKAWLHCATLANSIKQAKNFGLDAHLAPINLTKVNNYVQHTIQELQQENDIDIFERLGGSLLIGSAKFLNNQTVLVGNIQIHSKYFVIATGTREPVSSIVNFAQSDFLTYKQIFHKNTLSKKTIIIGGRLESLEIAQALTRFGSKVTLIFPQKNCLQLEDPELVNKLQTILEKEGVTFYFSTKVLQFYWQNQRKLLVCQDDSGDKFALDADEIINMQNNQPNIEELALPNAHVQHVQDGILVNSKLQTTQKNIFALGSVVKTPFKSVHLTEYQTNVILSNIAFKIPRNINYKLVPRILFTCPQLATVGTTQTHKLTDIPIDVLQFDFKNIDAAIYKQETTGTVKLICHGDKLLGASILGPMAAELITEYSFAIQVGAGVSEIANSIHAYPTLSQINKRVSHKIFNKHKTQTTVTMEKAMHKMHQVFAKLSFVD